MGHNCRFMQGPGTNPKELEQLRSAVAEERPVTVSFGSDSSAFDELRYRLSALKMHVRLLSLIAGTLA